MEPNQKVEKDLRTCQFKYSALLKICSELYLISYQIGTIDSFKLRITAEFCFAFIFAFIFTLQFAKIDPPTISRRDLRSCWFDFMRISAVFFVTCVSLHYIGIKQEGTKNAMSQDYLWMLVHLLSAVVAGGLIGLERTFHGRPAGFRTHTLVCLTSSLLMSVTYYQTAWLPPVYADAMRTDPTRMAQGIMTGVGFIGAGIIHMDGVTVRGLTTAASIWLTAAVGILYGIGFFYPAIVSTILALGVLAVFRWFEAKMPSETFAHHHIRFHRENTMPEPELRQLLTGHGFSISNLTYRLSNDRQDFEYRMIISTKDSSNVAKLAESLRKLDRVSEFRISPTSD